MFDTATVTIAGNVVADPKITGLPDDPSRVNFRVVSTHRRRDPESGEWVDAGEYGINVVCWRALARGVAGSVHRGQAVLVIGRVTERPYQGEDGARHYYTEVTADFVGHDLSKGISNFHRFNRLSRPDGPPPAPDGAPGAADHRGAADGAPGAADHRGAADDAFGAGEFDGPPEGAVGAAEPELAGV